MAEQKKTTYLVDVFRTLAKTIRIEAENKAEAEEIAYRMFEAGKLADWSDANMTDDFEAEANGRIDENGEEVY